MYSVYTLSDPRDKRIWYVGMSKDVPKRFTQHLNHSRGNQKKSAWIAELKSAWMLPTLEVLRSSPSLEEAQQQEQYWINHYLSLGMPLTNKDGTQGKLVRRGMVGARKSARTKELLAPSTWQHPEGKLLTVQEVSQRIHRSPDTVKRLLRTKVLTGYIIA